MKFDSVNSPFNKHREITLLTFLLHAFQGRTNTLYLITYISLSILGVSNKIQFIRSHIIFFYFISFSYERQKLINQEFGDVQGCHDTIYIQSGK